MIFSLPESGPRSPVTSRVITSMGPQNLHFKRVLWKITRFLGGRNLYCSWFWGLMDVITPFILDIIAVTYVSNQLLEQT